MTALRLAIVGAGSLTGVMLAIGLGLGSYWLSLAPQAFDAWLTAYFIFFLPGVVLSLVPALVGSLSGWRGAPAGSPARRWWGRSLSGLLVMVGVTACFHLPLNLWIWFGPPIADATLTLALYAWLFGHTARLLGALGATICVIEAIRQPSGPPGV